MTQEEKQKRMLEAPLQKLIIQLAVPTIISMLVTSFYNMADTFFVGKIGTSATAAVGVVFPLMSIIQAIGFFFGHGSGNAVARRLGANDTKSAEQLVSCGFYSSIGFGLIILIFGLIFLEQLSLILGSTVTILPHTKAYLKIILFGAPYMTAALVINNQLRFQGSALFAMIGITSGSVLNVILDPIFILSFGLGVEGAALATVLSQFVSFVILLIGYKKANCVAIHLEYIKFLPKQIKEIFSGGVPSLCRQGLASISTTILNLVASPFGDAAIAAMSIVMRITFFANSVIIGFGQGFQPVCGFNYGAGNKKRVKEAFWFSVKACTIILVVLGVVGFAFSDNLISVFRDDADVIKIGSLALKLQCATMPLMGWIIMNNMLFQTCKQTLPASFLAAARQGLFFLPAVIILPIVSGLFGIQLSQSVADIASFVFAVCINKVLSDRLFK